MTTELVITFVPTIIALDQAYDKLFLDAEGVAAAKRQGSVRTLGYMRRPAEERQCKNCVKNGDFSWILIGLSCCISAAIADVAAMSKWRVCFVHA